jgi:hypothetical protein
MRAATEQVAPVAAAVEKGGESESYVRVNITKQSKGFVYETTVTVQGNFTRDEIERRLQDMLAMSGRVARLEIQNRENADDAYRAGGRIGALVFGDVSETTIAKVAAEVSDPGWQAPPMAAPVQPTEPDAGQEDPVVDPWPPFDPLAFDPQSVVEHAEDVPF